MAGFSIESGSPRENSYAEAFNSRFLVELLAVEIIDGHYDVQALTVAWSNDYKIQRQHSSLGYLPPVEFFTAWAASTLAEALV